MSRGKSGVKKRKVRRASSSPHPSKVKRSGPVGDPPLKNVMYVPPYGNPACMNCRGHNSKHRDFA